jgi:hypothetical protein
VSVEGLVFWALDALHATMNAHTLAPSVMHFLDVVLLVVDAMMEISFVVS